MTGLAVATAALLVLAAALFTGSGWLLLAGLLLCVAAWRLRW